MKKVKLLIVVVITFFISTLNCFAQPTIYDRNTLPNYGVKKQIDISGKYNDIMETLAVDSSEKIYDFSNTIPDTDEEKLVAKINEFAKNNQLEFIIINDKNYYSADIKSYCDSQYKVSHLEEYNKKHVDAFYDYNDFGIGYPNNSGIVLYQNSAVNPCDDYLYTNLFLYGDAKNYITVQETYKIMENIIPYMNNKKYYEGVSIMLDQMSVYIRENKDASVVNEKITTPMEIEFPWKLIVFDFVLSLIIIIILIKKNIMITKEKKAINYVRRGSLKITNKRDRVIIL